MKITYYGSIDLKLLRKIQGLTVDQLADRVYCSPRTINRLEASNRTSNRDLAEKLATGFSYPFDQLFIPTNQRFLESIASRFPPVPLSAPLAGMTYYLLYFRRVSWWDANLWSKTKWVRAYNNDYEIRVIHELSNKGVQNLWNSGVPVITSTAEWKGYFYHATIGHMERIIASEDCLRECAPHTLRYYAVKPEVLLNAGLPDLILLGDYPNVPEVFSIRIR